MRTNITTETMAAIRVLRTDLSNPAASGSYAAVREAVKRLAEAGVFALVEERHHEALRAATGQFLAGPGEKIPFAVDLVYYTSVDGRVSHTRTSQRTVNAVDTGDALALAEQSLGDDLVRAGVIDNRMQLIVRSNDTRPA